MGDRTYERAGGIMICFLGAAYGLYKGMEIYFGMPWWVAFVAIMACCIFIFIQLLKSWDREFREMDAKAARERAEAAKKDGKDEKTAAEEEKKAAEPKKNK